MNGILGLINDVLQLSKLEDPEVTLSYEAFDAKQMAEDVLTIVKMRATEYGITVEYVPVSSVLPVRTSGEVRFTCARFLLMSSAIRSNIIKKAGRFQVKPCAGKRRKIRSYTMLRSKTPESE